MTKYGRLSRPLTGDLQSAVTAAASRAVRRVNTRAEMRRRGDETDGPGGAADSERVPAEGRPLSDATRSFFESRYGHDFSRVRVHTDEIAARAADALDASAFTIGEDIHFATERYQPNTPGGLRLLAHELAHTVQQSGPRELRSAPHAVPAKSASERSARQAADQVLHGGAAPELAASPVVIARDPKARPPGTSGHLKSDPNWSYIVYDNEVRLRYYRDLPEEQAVERKKKNLPGFVQVGTIPWVTNNPGNITQTPGAAPTTLQGYPAELGSIAAYGGRYSVFPTMEAGVGAIGPYLRKLPSFGKAPGLSMADTIKQYKGEEASEKAAREAREKENAERKSQGLPPLPEIDIRKKYLEDVKAAMRKRVVAAEALEGGEAASDLTPSQRQELEKLATRRISTFMATSAKDVSAGDPDLIHAVQAIYEVEGRAAAPGVSYSAAGFDDPTGRAAFDGEQKALIAKLIASKEAKDELNQLIGKP